MPREYWSIITERLSVTYVGAHKPDVLEMSYRRYEQKAYGLLPLTDEEWEHGCFHDVTPFGIVGQRHYARVVDAADWRRLADEVRPWSTEGT
jgi:hypothetical protein